MQGTGSYELDSTVATNMEGASRCQHAAVLWHALCQPVCWSTFAVLVMLNQSHTPLRPPARLIQSVVVVFFPHACVHVCVWVGVWVHALCVCVCVCVGGGGGMRTCAHIYYYTLVSFFFFSSSFSVFDTVFQRLHNKHTQLIFVLSFLHYFIWGNQSLSIFNTCMQV